MTGAGKRLSVLVVDDDADIVETVSEVLEMKGYAVTTASNGREALARLEDGTTSLVVLDLMMPVVDGGEVCRRMESDPKLRRIPIIVMTAADSSRCAGCCNGYPVIRKPFGLDSFLEKVEAAIGTAQAA